MQVAVFGGQNASHLFDRYLDEIKREIERKSNEYIVNVDIEEWKEFFHNEYDFMPIEVFEETAQVRFVKKGKKAVEERGQRYEIETYTFEFSVEFRGWSTLFTLIPSTRTLTHPMVNVPNLDQGEITAQFTLHSTDERQFEYEKNKLLKAITINVPNANRDLEKFKANIDRTFMISYNQKKQKVESENKFFNKLDLVVDKSTDKIFKVPFPKKKKLPEPVVDKKNVTRSQSSPIVPDAFYTDVLDVIYTFFKAVEKKPSTYKGKQEEDLRDYVLPTLETRYDDLTVTGETFNKGGKTDVLFKYKDGTNLFVAECKVWKGEKVLHDTINQLFDRYLTWRDSKVALIFFVNGKEFSKVLDKIKLTVKDHEYFVRDNGVRGESSFSYIFHFPTDKGKLIYTEIMAFHFPKELQSIIT